MILMVIAAPTVASEAKCAPITTLLIATKVPQTLPLLIRTYEGLLFI